MDRLHVWVCWLAFRCCWLILGRGLICLHSVAFLMMHVLALLSAFFQWPCLIRQDFGLWSRQSLSTIHHYTNVCPIHLLYQTWSQYLTEIWRHDMSIWSWEIFSFTRMSTIKDLDLLFDLNLIHTLGLIARNIGFHKGNYQDQLEQELSKEIILEWSWSVAITLSHSQKMIFARFWSFESNGNRKVYWEWKIWRW